MLCSKVLQNLTLLLSKINLRTFLLKHHYEFFVVYFISQKDNYGQLMFCNYIL